MNVHTQSMSNPASEAHSMMQALEQAKSDYLEAREELQSISEQVERNQRSLEAAKMEAEDLNQAWRKAAHDSKLKANTQIRQKLDASVEAKSNVDRLTMLANEGPELFSSTQEQTSEARKRYIQALNMARGPVLKAKAEEMLGVLKGREDIQAFFSEVNGHLRNLYNNHLVEQEHFFRARQGTSISEDERDLEDHAMNLAIRHGLVPMLQELGLDLDAEVPDDLVVIPRLAIEDYSMFG